MIVLLTIVLLIILLSRVAEELIKIPFALALIIFSYVLNLGFPTVFSALGENFDEILFLMLPMILLPDLLGLTVAEIRRHVWAFIYLAVFAVATSIAIASFITPYLLPEYQFTAGMMISLFAMLMATDAITVSSLFNRFSLPSKLKIYAEGESLFNDVTALIIFYFIAMPMLTGASISLAGINIVIFKVVFLSVLVGAAACSVGYFGLKLIKNPVEQFIIIYLVAILSFLLAEHWHISGILATVTSVIGLKYITTKEIVAHSLDKQDVHFKDSSSYYNLILELIKRVPALTPRGFIAYKKEAQYLGLFANAVVFISMANLLELSRIISYWQEILLVFGITTIIRSFFVFPYISYNRLPVRWATVLVLAGMKGGLAIIMAHSLPASFVYREMFEAIVIGNVVLTIFLYSFIMMAYLHYHHDGFETDRREQDPEPGLEELARQFQQVVEKHPVTNLYISSVFEEIIGNEIARTTRYGMDLSLVVLRLGESDGKALNDLAILAKTAREEARTSDIIGHLGSTDIGIVTTNTDLAGAKIMVGRICERVRKMEITVGVLAGISEFEQGDTVDLMLAEALTFLDEDRASTVSDYSEGLATV